MIESKPPREWTLSQAKDITVVIAGYDIPWGESVYVIERNAYEAVAQQLSLAEQDRDSWKQYHRILQDAANRRIGDLERERDQALELLRAATAALEWIADETKRDHREPDLYTKYGCVLHKADETLTIIRKDQL